MFFVTKNSTKKFNWQLKTQKLKGNKLKVGVLKTSDQESGKVPLSLNYGAKITPINGYT